jgi:hypothetical protein
MMSKFAGALLLTALWALSQQPDEQAPRAVDPGNSQKAPSDAIVLFDGKDVAQWTSADGSAARCTIEDDAMVCRSGAGDILSLEKFRSAQIHLEYAVPYMPNQSGQMRGNSGVYVQSCYEIQILDSYNNETYANGSNGAIYGQAPPLVNASRPPGEWQTYDIMFRAPRCENGKVKTQGTLTVLHNGVLIHDRFRLKGAGAGCQLTSLCEAGPLRLQDHSGFPDAPETVMKFRNIWLRKLD